MRCFCCDRELAPDEIQWSEDIQTWEMCSTCLLEALDAAFSDGFSIEDDGLVPIDSDFDDKYSESLVLFGYVVDRENRGSQDEQEEW